MSLLDAFEGRECFAVIQDFPSMRGVKLEGIERLYRLPIFFSYSRWLGFGLSLVWSFFKFLWIFSRERPSIIFSTGAEIAIPAFVVGKYFYGAKAVFLESLTRITSPSATGKWICRIADYFLVQNRELLNRYGTKVIYEGSLI